ncbi:MAG: diaminopimelate epimerase [Dehalococcoidia bacterium]
MRFTKMHGTGNDFVVIDARDSERDWAKLTVAMCDRHFGIGADGLLTVLLSERADLRMRMFNPDGSEAEMCGNGIRCFVKYAVEREIAALSDGALSVETLAGVLKTEATLVGERVESVRVAMGRPRLVAAQAEGPVKELPLDVDGTTYPVTCVSMGNPHAVHFIDTPVADFPLEAIGPKVEHHALFPDRANFEVARVLARHRIEARVWERGAGITLACGTGASAVAVAARLHGLVDEKVELLLPGGLLKLEWDGSGDVYLTGPAAEVFEGDWPE